MDNPRDQSIIVEQDLGAVTIARLQRGPTVTKRLSGGGGGGGA